MPEEMPKCRELPHEVRERTDALDMLGNTTAATGKGFAIGSAALTAMALLSAYMEEVKLWIGRMAAETADGIKQVGEVVFYSGTTAPQSQRSSCCFHCNRPHR